MTKISTIKINDFSKLKASVDWSFKDATRKDTTRYSHSYHRYPAKFIPHIVEKLVNTHTNAGDVVFDPFGGCGTTMVESKLLGRKSIGCDINPVAQFIADVKVTPISPKKLHEEYLLLEKRLSAKSRKNNNALKYLNNQRIVYWFDRQTILSLANIYTEIKKTKNRRMRRFFLCAFSQILKNCSRWLMQSIKPTLDKEKIPPSPKQIFLQHVRSMIKKNETYYTELKTKGNLKVPSHVSRRDATKKYNIKTNSVDLIVTSPPYVTSYEYADLHQLTLLWFGADRNEFPGWNNFSKDFTLFRKKFIGTSSKKGRKGETGSEIANQIILSIFEVDKSLSKGVANYFLDMNKAFREMSRVLNRGKKICVVIGNTELKGVKILNAEVAMEQLLGLGFKKVSIIKREVPNKMITPWRDSVTGKFTGLDNPTKKRAYQYEYIIVMKKPK